MNCTAHDIHVFSITAGSLVVDYTVRIPSVLATPEIKAAATAAIANPASAGLPVDTMAITIPTIDESGNTVMVTSSNTPAAVETFTSFAFVMIAGDCPSALNCSITC